MKKFLFLLAATLMMAVSTRAEVVTTGTWPSSSLMTYTQLLDMSGKSGHVAFSAVSENAATYHRWFNFLGGNVNAANQADLTKATLYTISGSTDAYHIQRVSDGNYLAGQNSFGATAMDLKLVSRLAGDYAAEYADAAYNVSIDNASGGHYNANSCQFAGGTGGYSAYAAYGPFYVVTVEYTLNSEVVATKDFIATAGQATINEAPSTKYLVRTPANVDVTADCKATVEVQLNPDYVQTFPDAGTYYVTLKCKDEGRNPYLYNDLRENTYTLQAQSLPSPLTNNYVWRVESDGTNLTIVNGDGRKIGVNGNVNKRLDAAWQFINKGDGYFYLKNADIIAGGNHECLNASNGGQHTTIDGANVRTATTWTGESHNDNLWKVETVEAPSVYNVEIKGAENAYVTFGSEHAYDGGFFLAESISDTQLTASTVAHHDANITISGTTITLTYTPSSAPDWEGLAELVATAKSYPVGAGLGQYSWIVYDEDYTSDWAESLEFYEGYVEAQDGDADFVDFLIESLSEAIGQLQLNMPKPNTFLRLKGFVNSSNYLLNTTSGGKYGMGTDNVKSIFYYDGQHLLSYENGIYFGASASSWAWIPVGSEGANISFTDCAGKGAYLVSIPTGDKAYTWLYSGASGATNADRGAADDKMTDTKYFWTLEEVTELPVTVTSAGYATLYAPVNLTIPADVKVYTLTEGEGSHLTPTQIEDIIPANTGVVLENEGTFSFTITDETVNHASCITGTCATIASAETDGNYVFFIKDSTPGFYKFVGSELKGFKAYYKPTVASINGFSLDFGGQIAGVNSVISATNLKAGYDIQGRKLNKIQKGINILNGKKIIK